MNAYRVWFDNGAAVLVNADTPAEACILAEDLATRDGHAGLRAIKAERLN